jgi:microfibrillar-associated protein 1
VAEKQVLAEYYEEAIRKKREEAEQRRKESHDLVAESIRRELLERRVVSTMDFVFMSLQKKKKRNSSMSMTRMALIREATSRTRTNQTRPGSRDHPRGVERRRALPLEQRLKEDLAHAQRSREEKPKGSQQFMQQYWHKGCFLCGGPHMKKRVKSSPRLTSL